MSIFNTTVHNLNKKTPIRTFHICLVKRPEGRLDLIDKEVYANSILAS